MSKAKRHKKKHHHGATDENKKTNEHSTSQLFSEADAKSIETSGYSMSHGALQTNRFMQERTIPTGVVDIDESVQLPKPSSKLHHRHHHSKLNSVLQPNESYHKEHVHLPPISDRSHHHHHNHPSGYLNAPSDYYHFEHLSHSNPVGHEHESSHHRHHHHHQQQQQQHNHHQHKHHHRHHHQHQHEKEVETYDSRWWYMPVNSVHAPKPWRPPEYHYVAPKWYESPSKESRISIDTPESRLSPRKYIDCRCGVCKPPKDTPRGIKWIVNE
ncbi:unnamed protein product [Rotaria sp. Silwood1]|nr:unnamed protein product [Rotaria sp. Silwood1]CAF0770274.1 unnamed protein product [Rotaria sp. Silwood1]